MKDPIFEVAHDRAIQLSAEIEVQLSGAVGTSPILAMLELAKAECAIAMNQLVRADPMKHDEVHALQGECLRFDSLIRWLSKLVAKGFEADKELTEAERNDYADMIVSNPDALDPDEAEEAGIIQGILRDA